MPDNNVTNTFAYIPPPFSQGQDQSYGNGPQFSTWFSEGGAPPPPSSTNQSDTQPITWTHNNNGSSSSSRTPGERLTDILTPSTPNSATVLELHNRLLLYAGADAHLNATEGAKALFISENEMKRIIEHMGGEDATSVSVTEMLSKLEPFVSSGSPPRVSNKGIDDWIMEMKGGKNNFFSWAGEDGQLNLSEFQSLGQALMSDYSGQYSDQINAMGGIGPAEWRQMFESGLAGADNRIDPNEFGAAFTAVGEDGRFNWEEAQDAVALLALQLGPANSQSNNTQTASNSGGSGGNFNVTYTGPDQNLTWTPNEHI